MKRRHFLPLCAAASPFSFPFALVSTVKTADFSELDARLQQRVASGWFDGMGLVIGRGEQLLHSAHIGRAGPHQVLHVASTGKWVAAAVIASLVDDGLLGWDDPVGKFLPQFSGTMGQASVRQLLSHTAGYPDYQPADRRRDDYPTLAESVAHIVGLPPVDEPGARFHYGGLAMQVAGRMAELAGGADFHSLFLSRLARPLGMTLSGFSPVSTEPGFNPILGGSFFTCTQDYARFLMMMAGRGRFGGRRVLSEAAVDALLADQVRGAEVKAGEYVELARQARHRDVYGLGLWREELDKRGKATLFSSPGWAGAYAWLDTRADLWGVVIAKANVDKARADGYSTFLGSSIYAPMAREAMSDAVSTTRRSSVRLASGAGLFVEESGEGEPLVLLHGHSFDRRQWAPQVKALSARYRVIRYDLRGYGRSSEPVEGQHFTHADDLLALLDHLGIARAHLMGLSLGGFVVTDFLALHPGRVCSAIMAGGDLFDVPGPESPWTPLTLAARRRAIADVRAEGVHAVKRRWLEQLVGGSGSSKESLRQPLWAMIDEWTGWQLTHVEPRLLLGRSAVGALETSRPTAPVLLIRGDRESVGLDIQRLLPQARLHTIPDCGHVSNLEQPHIFNRVVTEFLDSVG
ncbi:alpha/beta fold hydrolase [Roseateles sp.]|uniref:alpha/beta fold hydrolase n=1 Tax=Roseateles sp. TaxID=1971397 RepID=UPI0039EB7C68